MFLAGCILTFKPDLLVKFQPPIDAYQMIEKRVKWGFLIGLGIFLTFHDDWASWGLSITALLAALTFGLIISRITGIILDGYFSKQLIWLLTEVVAFVIFGFLYWRQKV